MIENRNLKTGTRLVARYHKQSYTCEVVEGEGGKLRYRLEDGREFKSPSAAGTAITGKSCNGWAFWSVQSGDVAAPEAETATQPSGEGEATLELLVTRDGIKKISGQAEPPAPPAEEAGQAARRVFRVANQKGVPEGQTRWHCKDCSRSFLAPAGETPEACPLEHQAA